MIKVYKPLLIVFSLLSTQAFSQNVFIADQNGKPVTEKKYENIVGSAFFEESWLKGMVRLSDGRTFKDIELKYDQVKDVLLFKGANNQMLEFVNPVVEFKITTSDRGDVLFKSGFKALKNITPSTFFEVLYNGPVSLLKRTQKVMVESKGYNSATANWNIDVVTTYYISNNGILAELKKSKQGVLQVLPKNNVAIEEYIEKNKLNLKNDSDLIRVVTYYNSQN